MQQNSHIRPVSIEDLGALKLVIDLNELFPSELLDDMISPYFNGNKEDFWITYEEDNVSVAVAFYAPEKMTNGTYNIYLIAVHPNFQGKNIGRELLLYIEQHLKSRNERIVLIETSGLPEFENARKFYRKNGYHQEAVVREFYAEGDDKVIFHKFLKERDL